MGSSQWGLIWLRGFKSPGVGGVGAGGQQMEAGAWTLPLCRLGARMAHAITKGVGGMEVDTLGRLRASMGPGREEEEEEEGEGETRAGGD